MYKSTKDAEQIADWIKKRLKNGEPLNDYSNEIDDMLERLWNDYEKTDDKSMKEKIAVAFLSGTGWLEKHDDMIKRTTENNCHNEINVDELWEYIREACEMSIEDEVKFFGQDKDPFDDYSAYDFMKKFKEYKEYKNRKAKEIKELNNKLHKEKSICNTCKKGNNCKFGDTIGATVKCALYEEKEKDEHEFADKPTFETALSCDEIAKIFTDLVFGRD